MSGGFLWLKIGLLSGRMGWGRGAISDGIFIQQWMIGLPFRGMYPRTTECEKKQFYAEFLTLIMIIPRYIYEIVNIFGNCYYQ